MATGRLRVGVPQPFSLDRVARSHGWYDLPPTTYTTGALGRVLDLPDAGVVHVTVRQPRANELAVQWRAEETSDTDRAAMRRDVTHMLALDADLSELHAACARVEHLAWVPQVGAGRLLRSPTVWEDLVKTLCTTNCSWSATRSMVGRLVDTLGPAGSHGARGFPCPAAVAAAGDAHLRAVVRMGYRTEALLDLAETIASGTLDPQQWLDPALTDEEVLAALLRLRGFGPYAAEGMLGLLGRPRGLALDSWVRTRLPTLIGRKRMTDKQIAARYAKLGRWAGTGLWLEATQHWFAENAEPLTLPG